MISISELVEKVEKINPSNKDGSWKYIDIASVDRFQKKIVLESVSDITPESAPSRARQLVSAGDIIISTVRPNLNTVAIIPKELDGAIASTGFCVLRPNKLKVDTKYLFHYVKSEAFVNSLVKLATGANYPAVSDKIIKEQQLKSISLCEQKEIAATLDKVENILHKREQAIKLADDFLRANFLKFFGDPISNPKNWELRKLGEIADCQLGKMLSKKSKTGLSPKKYLRNANIRWRKIDVNDLLEMDFNEKELSKFELKRGDLLVCEGGEIGRCAIWDNQIQDCYYQKALHRVRPDYNVLTSVYLQEYFYSMAKGNAFSEFVSEVTFSHLTAEKLKNLLIPIPEISIQRKFEIIYNKLNTLIYDKYSDGISLTLLSNAINKKLFNHL
ncbi:restriction endonuclease subunit S [Salmonella enterica]|nr:restriction endonuclease subunit S [Salmonella enterica]EMA5837816.1 restriction endonuclease subunit S [Salmonella enterica]EMA6041935.1 restriction endonuclease subunit S [Salmonella enterica]